MTDKPSFYTWLVKIAIVIAVVAFTYAFVYIDRRHPDLKKTRIFQFIITPLLYIIGFILIILFIA